MTAFILKQLRKEQKGFTLIELLAVIVILGVIAAIAVPLIGKVVDNSKKSSDIATAVQIYQASKLYVATELDGVSESLILPLKTLQTKNYLDSKLSLPSTKSEITAGTINYSATGALVNILLTSDSIQYTCPAADVTTGKGECSPTTP